MKIFYAVFVSPEGQLGKVSQEGYSSLAKAQAFIESRADKPRKLTSHHYRTDDLATNYVICEVHVE